MDVANNLILFLGALFIASILAGLVSSRIGAPLLLVFLGLGMLLGEDGLVGLRFNDFETTYVVGSIALAVILFDGGFRTPMSSIRVVWAPATVLATIGVILTALVTGLVAAFVFDGGWLQGMLIAATIASTDAAAVFLLLHQRGMELKKRLSATLEVESGANDPMAIFLTIFLVQMVIAYGEASSPLALLQAFASQFVIGAIMGVAGGFVIAAAVNKLDLEQGLYPVFVVASAFLIFGVAQKLGGSGFLAVYLAGIVSGNQRIRAGRLIRRFHDGIAWTSQIIMFVLLGLLVTPSALMDDLVPGILVALALCFVARPIAVYLCLIPFRFTREERLFIAWVGLRGAVPLFLAMIPVLGGLENSLRYFHVAFVVVIFSLVLQGWTIPLLARRLNLELPPKLEPPGKMDLSLLSEQDREVTAYRVSSKSPILGKTREQLQLPSGCRVVAVLRGNHVLDFEALDHFQVLDVLLVICPPEQGFVLDRQFTPRPTAGRQGSMSLGDFAFSGRTPMGVLMDLYGLPVADGERDKTVSRYLREQLGSRLAEGEVLAIGDSELVVREMVGDEVHEVGLRLEPEPTPALVVKLAAIAAELRQTLARAGRLTMRLVKTAWERHRSRQ